MTELRPVPMGFQIAAWFAVMPMFFAPAWAGTPEPSPVFGSKFSTLHQVKNLVGPTVQIDEQGLIAATWVEEDKDTRTIFFAKSEKPGGPLGTPVRVNQPTEVPYFRQESPALAIRGGDVFITWAVTHPKISPDKPFSSDLRLSRSTDGGKTFAPSTLVNDDGLVINHTFDSIHIGSDGAIHVAWIDGRDGKKDPATFIARSGDHGQTLTANTKLDDNTCVCCRTSVTSGPDGTLYVAWRKVLPGDIRETVVAHSTDGGSTFSAPVIVGNDRWVFQGCPHRPASLGVDRQGRVYVTWYTEGDDETPSVYLAYSDDRGATFSEKQKLNVSKGTFPDHPQMAVDREGRVIVAWEEQSPVRREVVMSVSSDRGKTFNAPLKLNDKKGQTPSIAVNSQGTAVLAWMEHAMPGHKMVVQTLQLPASTMHVTHATP